MTRPDLKPETLVAQALHSIDRETGAVVPPIYTATTYERDKDTKYSRGQVYTRWSNPSFTPVENVMTKLEGGEDALLFASGMAASTAVFQTLRPGDHVVVGEVIYYELYSWLKGSAREWGLEVTFVDGGDLDAIRKAVRPGVTKLLWFETPANPMWTIVDIAGAAEIAKDAGAKLAIDSTCASPILTRPLALGADIVMHSATKYLNGHSDVLAGLLITKAKDEWWECISQVRHQQGAVPGPVEAAMLLRGMRTLAIRVKTNCENASILAQRLEAHPHVAQVLFPGLDCHPGHLVAAKQMEGGFGGMMSIRVKGGEAAAIQTIANAEVWIRATSLGSVESLIEHRASIETTETATPRDLIRLSAGIENVDDLYDDLDAALRKAH